MFETKSFAAAAVPGTGISMAFEPMTFGARQAEGAAVPATVSVAGAYDPVRHITVENGAPLALATPERTLFETKQGNQTWMDSEK